MARQDIILDADNNFSVVNGDFQIGNSDDQSVQLILSSYKGQWLQHPLIGASLEKFVRGRINETEIKKLIRTELQRDGYVINKLTVLADGQISIDYKSA